MKIFISFLAVLFVSNFAFATTPNMNAKEMVAALLASNATTDDCSDKSMTVSEVLNEWLTTSTKEYPGYLEAAPDTDNFYCLYFMTLNLKATNEDEKTNYAEALCFSAFDKVVDPTTVSHYCY